MRRAILILTLILMSLLAGCIEAEQAVEDSLASYKQSLLPTFRENVAAVGDIPRYRIAVRLDADTLTLTGRQQVVYTNNEGNKLGGIYFRLYHNLPSVICCNNMPSVA